MTRIDSRAGDFRFDIQGLRAVAVGAVLAYHAGLTFVPGGFVGVDVFFVISGFLITGLLLRERERNGRISLSAFYARRVRRILPASLVVAVATLGVAIFLVPPSRLVEVAQDGLASVLFLPNFWFGVQADDYLAGESTSLFQHYWSLGVEEQYYLVWPLLLIAVLALRRRAAVVVAAAIVLIGSLTACLLTMAWSPTWAFYSIHTRAWEFAAGALVAIVLARRLKATDGPRAGWVGSVVGWVGLAAIVASVVTLGDRTPFPGPWAALPVVGTILVIAAPEFGDRYGVRLVLGIRPLRFIGLISFSLYLIHWPALELVREATGLDRLPLRIAVLVTLVSVALAVLSHRHIERPFLEYRVRRPEPSLLAGAAATLLAASLSVGTGALATLLPADDGRIAPTADGATPYVPSDLTPSLSNAKKDRAILYDNGCHTPFRVSEWKDCRFGAVGSEITVALFGDSHAATWFPALERVAREQGFELRVFTKSSCPASAMEMILDGQEDIWCSEWRASVIAELERSPVNLVVVADHFANPTQARALAAGDSVVGDWAMGAGTTVSALLRSAPVLVLGDVANFGLDDPVRCLAEHLDDALSCGARAEEVFPFESNARVQAVVTALGASYADFPEELCPDGFCAVIRGHTLVYRDEDHLTATFSRKLSHTVGTIVADLLD